VAVIRQVQTPRAFYVLALLIVESALTVTVGLVNAEHKAAVFYSIIGVFVMVILIVTVLVGWDPKRLLYGKEELANPALKRKGVNHRLGLRLSDGYVAMSAHPAVQRGVCALGSPKLHACGDPFDWQGGLASQTRSDDKLARLVFRARRQITLAPLQSTHFFFQAIRMDLPAGFLACFSQGLEKVLAVHVVEKYVLPPITSIHHVINRSGVLHSHLPQHAGRFRKTPCQRRVSERLRMGDESRVTQAIRRVKRRLEPAMQHLKERLDKAFESGLPTDT
jgi:hypothetical protein